MAIPLTGTISMSQIRTELDNSAPGTSTSLFSASTGVYKTISSSTAYKPDGIAPHAMSEFRGYTQYNPPTSFQYSMRSGFGTCNGNGQVSIGSPVNRTVYSSSSVLTTGSALYSDAGLTTLTPYTYFEHSSVSKYYYVSNGIINDIYAFGSPC